MHEPATPTENGNGARSRGDGARSVYTALRAEILSLALEPGCLLDEARLAQRFGVSRSPVREALIRLRSEGLVTTLPNRSTLVTPLNVDTFPEYLDALDLLQRATTRLAALKRSDADLERIRAAQAAFETTLEGGDALAMIEANREFHVAIGAAGGNRFLAEACARLLDEGRRFLRLYFRAYGDAMPAEFADEHPRIIAAIEAKDADAAERLAHEHALQMNRGFLAFLDTRHTDAVAVTGAAAVQAGRDQGRASRR